jgi:hypothetical protein
MRSKHRIIVVFAAAALGLAVAVAASARQTSARSGSGAWSRISGPNNTGQQLGLARTSDGVLHVVWNRGAPAPTSIFDTRFSPTGAKLGTTAVATNFGGAGGLALLVMPDGTLRLFASGAPVTGSAVVGINTFTGQANGTGWQLDQGAVWGGPTAGAAATVGAALTRDGQPVTGWDGVDYTGLAGGGTGTTVCSCFSLEGDLATDAGSGAVFMSGIGQPSGYKLAGTFVQQALPSIGNRVVLPSASQGFGDSGISARLGAPGIYVAYSDNTRSGVAKPAVRLYRYGGATRTIAHGPFTIAKVFAGPAGRLWLAWGDAADGVFVTRTSKSVGRLEPVQKLKSPPGTGFLRNAEGEGSMGALDLFVDSDAGGVGFWHTHVLALLQTSASTAKGAKGKPSTVTVHVTDAGDPVAGASVKIGSQSHTTDASGKASFSEPAQRTLHGTVSASGYKSAALTAHS